MARNKASIYCASVLLYLVQLLTISAEETVLSLVLTPTEKNKNKPLSRQGRSYYDQRYGTGRPYERLENERPGRCGRCDEDKYNDSDDYDRQRDRYDDDRRHSQQPTYRNRYDKNSSDEDDDRRFNNDRKNMQKNGTEVDKNEDRRNDGKERDTRPSGSRTRGDRDRDQDRYNRNRHRYDDRDRYRPDYYDRFLRDPYRERDYDRDYYDDGYRDRRPLFERYPQNDRYGDPYSGRYDGYSGYRRSGYDDRFDRGSSYDDGYGGYGPGLGRGAHDSFRPWDETYRGQAGWDSGGRGYYFASGRPDSAPAQPWGRQEYSRPDYGSGWQNAGYSGGGGYRDQLEYRGSLGYQQNGAGYSQDLNAAYGRPSGWHSVGERRTYRDQSGVANLGDRGFDQGQASTYVTKTYASSTSTTPGNSYLYQREDQQITNKPEQVSNAEDKSLN